MSDYGNHNEAYSLRCRQLNIQNWFGHQNGITVSTEILNVHLWSDDSSNETLKQNFEMKDPAPVRRTKCTHCIILLFLYVKW